MTAQIEAKESQNVEWKESWRDEYLKWICGFANAKGGTIYIGVNDQGEVLGVKDGKRLLEDVPSKIQMSLGIVCDVDLHTADGKDYLQITVLPSSFPVSYRGEFHYRSGSTRRQLTGLALADFVMRRAGASWEDTVVERATIADVDQEAIKIFRREARRRKRMTEEELAVSDAELLEKLGVLEDGHLTRAGVLLFTDKHYLAQTATYTKVGMFGERRSDLLYQDDFEGALIVTAAKIVDTIYLKYLRGKVSYEGVVRVETYPFEYDAVREGIYNALIHNVYMTGTPIQIRIDEHTMEISNSCILPEDWTGESLMSPHKSKPYNPTIAKVFYRMGYIENWGRGIEKIVAACDELGAPRPEYQVLGYGITLTLHALESAFIRDNIGTGSASANSLNEADEANSDAERDAGSYALEHKIIDLLSQDGSMRQARLANTLGVSRATLQRAMKRLTDARVIKRIGNRRTGTWQVLGSVENLDQDSGRQE